MNAREVYFLLNLRKIRKRLVFAENQCCTTIEKRDSTVKRSKIRAGGLFVFGQTQLRQIFQVGQLDNSPERLHFNALLHPSEAISHKDALKVVLAPCISNVIPHITFDQNPSFRKSRIHDRVCGKLRFDHQH
jgi:hypothetical protein